MKMEVEMEQNCKKRLKVCLLVKEYFGAMGTFWGGYGFLARHIIAKLISKYSNIEVEVCLGKRDKRRFSIACYVQALIKKIDGVPVFRLPRRKFFASRFLASRNYDAFLSIEDSGNYAIACDTRKTPWLFWIQDPRPWYEWREIWTVSLVQEKGYYSVSSYENVHRYSMGGGVHPLHFSSSQLE